MPDLRNNITTEVTSGASRLIYDLGYAPLTEFRLKIGRRADICGINDKGEIIIIEVKSSYEDYRTDNKWHEYIDYCDRFYFAVDKNFPQDIIPTDKGLIIADKFGGMILREAEIHKLPPARRKSVTLLFARQAALSNY
jgi:hypothetical protein